MTSTDDEAVETIPPSQCLALLRDAAIGRLGVVTEDGGVDIFPVNFIVDHGEILFRTDAGTKLDRVVEHGRVGFEADHFDWYERTAWSVIVKGAASLVSGRADLIDLFDVDVVGWHPGPKPHFVRIEPDSITGRRFRVVAGKSP